MIGLVRMYATTGVAHYLVLMPGASRQAWVRRALAPPQMGERSHPSLASHADRPKWQAHRAPLDVDRRLMPFRRHPDALLVSRDDQARRRGRLLAVKAVGLRFIGTRSLASDITPNHEPDDRDGADERRWHGGRHDHQGNGVGWHRVARAQAGVQRSAPQP